MKRLLPMHIVLVSMASIAIPLSGYYIKMDWLSALILTSMLIVPGFRISPFPLKYTMIFIGVLLLNGIVAAFGNEFDVNSYLKYFGQYCLALTVLIVLVSMRIDLMTARKVMNIWVIVACLASILAIAQKLTNQLLIDNFLFIPYYDDSQISLKTVSGILAPTAWFAEASWLGSFLVVPATYVIFELTQRKKRLLQSALIVSGLLLSYSITAILSVVIGILAMIALSKKSTAMIIVLAGLFLGIWIFIEDLQLITLIILRFSELAANISDFSPGDTTYGTVTSFYVRSIGFAQGINDFINNMIFGIGLGQSNVPYHSGFIAVLAEQGLIGLTINLALLLIAITRLLKIAKHPEYKIIAQAFIVCIFADYANAMITHNWFHLQRWLLISIVFSFIEGYKYSLSRVI